MIDDILANLELRINVYEDLRRKAYDEGDHDTFIQFTGSTLALQAVKKELQMEYKSA